MTAEHPTRRELLGVFATSAVAGSAGCTDDSTEPAASGVSDEDWPLPDRDPYNSGYNPDTSGPTTSPSVRWESTSTRDRPEWPGYYPRPLAVGDGVVYTGDDRLRALDAEDGSVEWETDLAAPFGGVVTDGDRLFVLELDHPDEEGVATDRLSAFDADDGSHQWGIDGDWLNPGPPTIAGETLYLPTGDGIEAVDPDGTPLWEIEDRTAPRGRIPAVSESLLAYSTTAYARNRSLVERTLDRPPSRTFAVESQWFALASPAITDSVVVIPESIVDPRDEPENDARLLVTDHRGEHEWQAEIGSRCSSPAIADGTVYVHAASHRETYDAAELDRYDEADDLVEMRRDAELLAFDLESGDRQWGLTYEYLGNWRVSPVVADGVLYAALYDVVDDEARLVAVRDGEELWSHELRLPATHLAVVNGTLYATLEDWSVVALS